MGRHGFAEGLLGILMVAEWIGGAAGYATLTEGAIGRMAGSRGKIEEGRP
jgi:hypothetical protein